MATVSSTEIAVPAYEYNVTGLSQTQAEALQGLLNGVGSSSPLVPVRDALQAELNNPDGA